MCCTRFWILASGWNEVCGERLPRPTRQGSGSNGLGKQQLRKALKALEKGYDLYDEFDMFTDFDELPEKEAPDDR